VPMLKFLVDAHELAALASISGRDGVRGTRNEALVIAHGGRADAENFWRET